MRITIHDTGGLGEAAREFLKEMQGHTIFAFYGQMGSGKTTFIKAICREMGVRDNVTSPSFTLVNEYHRPGKTPLYHFDFYRIKKVSEVLDIGIEEYFASGSPCFMEWPELIEPLLPEETQRFLITVAADGSRIIEKISGAPAGENLFIPS